MFQIHNNNSMTIKLAPFDTLIFDFGGVIFDIDPDRSAKAFANLIGPAKLNEIEATGLLWEYEKGNIDTPTFYTSFCSQAGADIPFEVFNRAWCAMLVGYQRKRIEYLRWLQKSHRLIMLSNTNQMHYNHFSGKLQTEYGVTFQQLFHHVYLSYQMRLIKPDTAIYRKVLVEQNLMPEKTLFIEDSRANADAAKTLGIETLVIPRNGSFYTFFDAE
jgi:glucose-1-phosphatase